MEVRREGSKIILTIETSEILKQKRGYKKKKSAYWSSPDKILKHLAGEKHDP